MTQIGNYFLKALNVHPIEKLSDKRDLNFPHIQINSSSKVFIMNTIFYFLASDLKQNLEPMLKIERIYYNFFRLICSLLRKILLFQFNKYHCLAREMVQWARVLVLYCKHGDFCLNLQHLHKYPELAICDNKAYVVY